MDAGKGRCGSCSFNRICLGTTEIEQLFRENDTSRNDRSRLHCTLIFGVVGILVKLLGHIRLQQTQQTGELLIEGYHHQ
jgi:hypothetical protein